MSVHYKALIVDDEVHGQENIHILLKEYFPEIAVFKAGNAFEARTLITVQQPQIVFLDVNMSKVSGVELLESLENRNFKTIFVTAYKEYALKALNLGATGYLLKPVIHEEFIQAVNLTLQSINFNQAPVQIKESPAEDSDSTESWMIKHSKGFDLIAWNEIIRIEALSNYARIILDSGKIITVARTLKSIEGELNKNVFIRVHKTHIINLNFILGYSAANNGEVILKDGSRIKVAVLRKSEVRKRVIDFLQK